MVVFTCGHCGESVQKPKVEKHYMTKCRNRSPNLSCMDCFKDFLGQDYESHTKCVTEEQRYGGKGFVPKEKKGEQKQEAWVDLVQSVLDEQKNTPKNVIKIIEGVSKHQNTPRKKPKFVNFVKNVCGHRTNPSDIDAAWDILSIKLSQLSTGSQKKPQVNGSPKEEKTTEPDVNPNDSTESVNDKEEVKQEETVMQVDEVLSKKQRKEEKKRKKYEEALKSAAVAPDDEEEEDKTGKKEKKIRHKSETIEEGAEETFNGKKKNKKRKRIDTVNEPNDVTVPESEVVPENGKVVEKPIPKKQKPELERSISLHDQNVATTNDDEFKKEKFNWHNAIIEVLRKKGNEIPFKRLQKKVLGEYSEATGCIVDDRIADKFIKKLKSAPKVKVDKNRVVLED